MKKHKREIKMTIRLNEKEYENLMAYADKNMITQSEAVRELINRKLS